jgi:hypothetical protein
MIRPLLRQPISPRPRLHCGALLGRLLLLAVLLGTPLYCVLHCAPLAHHDDTPVAFAFFCHEPAGTEPASVPPHILPLAVYPLLLPALLWLCPPLAQGRRGLLTLPSLRSLRPAPQTPPPRLLSTTTD